MGARLLVEALELIESGRATFTSQDHAKATHSRILEKADGKIRWSAPARRIHNLVRAALPWPGAQTRLGDEVVQIHRSETADGVEDAPPGTIVRVEKDRVIVATGQGGLAVLMIQPPGKRSMAMADYLRGHPLHPGQRFEEA
jgi:methionyl-tRNA formyltransferase